MVNVKKKCDSSGKSDGAMTLHVIDRLLPLSAGRQNRLLCVFFSPHKVSYLMILRFSLIMLDVLKIEAAELQPNPVALQPPFKMDVTATNTCCHLQDSAGMCAAKGTSWAFRLFSVSKLADFYSFFFYPLLHTIQKIRICIYLNFLILF